MGSVMIWWVLIMIYFKMARALETIQQVIIDKLAGLGIAVSDNFFSRRRLWTYVMADQVNVLEQELDQHKAEVEEDLKNLKPASLDWYKYKLLNFQYGFPLIPETSEFDNTGYTDDQIEASKVIKYAAPLRIIQPNGHIIIKGKIAGYDGNDIVPLDQSVIDAVNYYFIQDKAAPAGDDFVASSGPADKIQMKWVIQYDPVVLNAQGARNDGTSASPVEDAIKDFLKTVYQFGGRYSITFHIDEIQKVPGVKKPLVQSCKATYGSRPWQSINDEYIPDSGYLKFYDDTDLEIIYEPYAL